MSYMRTALFGTGLLLCSPLASSFSFSSNYYAVYEASISGGNKYVYIVPKPSILIIASCIAIPVTFMPQTNGFRAILAPDGSLASFQNVSLTSNDMALVGAVLSSYKLYGGDFDGDGKPDFFLQGRDDRQSVVLTADAAGVPQIYFNFGSALNSAIFPHVTIVDADQSGRSDIVVTNTSANTTTYFSNGNSPGFQGVDNGGGGTNPNQETTSYSYDAKGRLIFVSKFGGPSKGVNSSYTYDRADNRTNVTTTGSANGAGSNDGASANISASGVIPAR